VFALTLRRVTLTVLILADVGAAAAGIANATGGAQLANQNRVYGGGQFTVSAGDVRNFAIDAHGNGGTAYGDIEYGGALHWSHEQVTCLNVVGSSATVGAVVTQADRTNTIGWLALWVVQDNGNLLSATPDAATLQEFSPAGPTGGWPAGFPSVCPSPDSATSSFVLSYIPLNAGDIVVQDAASS
jgi:hypothetical protein